MTRLVRGKSWVSVCCVKIFMIMFRLNWNLLTASAIIMHSETTDIFTPYKLLVWLAYIMNNCFYTWQHLQKVTFDDAFCSLLCDQIPDALVTSRYRGSIRLAERNERDKDADRADYAHSQRDYYFGAAPGLDLEKRDRILYRMRSAIGSQCNTLKYVSIDLSKMG